MIPPQDAARLTEAIARERRSLLQYLHDSYPWVKAGTGDSLSKVRSLTQAEADTVAGMTRFLTRHKYVAPVSGSYPAAYTSMNFVSLDYLIPRLAEDQARLVSALEKDRATLTDSAAIAEVDRLLDLKRRNLATLGALAPNPAAS